MSIWIISKGEPRRIRALLLHTEPDRTAMVMRMKFGRPELLNDDFRAATLQLTAIRHQAAVTAWRETMIEAAGDFMCGAAHGPSRADAETLNRLEEAEWVARLAYTRFVIASATRRDAAAATTT